MSVLLSLAALSLLGARAATAAKEDDYYDCLLVHPSAEGNIEVSSRLSTAGKPRFRSLIWRSSSFSRLMMLGSWSPEPAGPKSGPGRMLMSYFVERAHQRGLFRFRIGAALQGGAIQVLVASDPIRPDRDGSLYFGLDWNAFRALVRGTALLEIAVIGPHGEVLDRRHLAGNGFDFVDSQLAPALAEFDAMVADYRNKCDFSGDMIVVT